MPTAAFTSTFDVAELTLYAFFLFFAGLVYYLRREDKRDGYPLVSDRSDRIKVQGWPPIPAPKPFVLPHVGPEIVPRRERDLTGLMVPGAAWPGAPMEPLGDPMQDGVGVASYAERKDEPDLTFDTNEPKIVPLRAAPGYYLATEDPDPRGFDVVTTDGVVAGFVNEAWIDRSETFVRYLEVTVPRPKDWPIAPLDANPTAPLPQAVGDDHPVPIEEAMQTGTRRVLVPMLLCRIDGGQRRVRIASVLSHQLAAAPAIRHRDEITLKEEDRIAGYFAGGHIYATPDRMGPLL
ncbi:photosynthetic reaction center subunit H [Roseomonas sp. CCTCC AB2023176]|uniref:photosynthetic reaction center subunit H n=1 Tax=Roseomonas sp. CCTCC AB2023176 TaxID=3342640 RepID=UPI0035DDC9E0